MCWATVNRPGHRGLGTEKLFQNITSREQKSPGMQKKRERTGKGIMGRPEKEFEGLGDPQQIKEKWWWGAVGNPDIARGWGPPGS